MRVARSSAEIEIVTLPVHGDPDLHGGPHYWGMSEHKIDMTAAVIFTQKIKEELERGSAESVGNAIVWTRDLLKWLVDNDEGTAESAVSELSRKRLTAFERRLELTYERTGELGDKCRSYEQAFDQIEQRFRENEQALKVHALHLQGNDERMDSLVFDFHERLQLEHREIESLRDRVTEANDRALSNAQAMDALCERVAAIESEELGIELAALRERVVAIEKMESRREQLARLALSFHPTQNTNAIYGKFAQAPKPEAERDAEPSMLNRDDFQSIAIDAWQMRQVIDILEEDAHEKRGPKAIDSLNKLYQSYERARAKLMGALCDAEGLGMRIVNAQTVDEFREAVTNAMGSWKGARRGGDR